MNRQQWTNAAEAMRNLAQLELQAMASTLTEIYNTDRRDYWRALHRQHFISANQHKRFYFRKAALEQQKEMQQCT